MTPSFIPGNIVTASAIPYLFSKPKIGDVVLFKHDGKIMLKRIREIENNKLSLKGDNKKDSLDPGFIFTKNVWGKVMFKI